MNTINLILQNYPPASINNSREIIKSYLEKFMKYKNEYYAKVLEDFGIDVDFNNYDNGK
jgi:hypothetical protein